MMEHSTINIEGPMTSSRSNIVAGSPPSIIAASSVFSSLTLEDLFPNAASMNNGGIELHPLLVKNPDHHDTTHRATDRRFNNKKNHRGHHHHHGTTKHRRYKTMEVVPTYMKPIPVKRPEPIVEETQETFGWGDFPVSKRMLPIPSLRKKQDHRRHHTIL